MFKIESKLVKSYSSQLPVDNISEEEIDYTVFNVNRLYPFLRMIFWTCVNMLFSLLLHLGSAPPKIKQLIIHNLQPFVFGGLGLLVYIIYAVFMTFPWVICIIAIMAIVYIFFKVWKQLKHNQVFENDTIVINTETCNDISIVAEPLSPINVITLNETVMDNPEATLININIKEQIVNKKKLPKQDPFLNFYLNQCYEESDRFIVV